MAQFIAIHSGFLYNVLRAFRTLGNALVCEPCADHGLSRGRLVVWYLWAWGSQCPVSPWPELCSGLTM